MSVVAIVGRPNVGKSALFNRIIGKRKALVSDMVGVTRDRHYAQTDWQGTSFALIDTGGLSFDETDAVEAKVHKQSLAALDEATVVICLFDGKDGITNIDKDVVDIFRKSGKPVVFAVNKIDAESNETLALEFLSLGIDYISISAEHNRGVGDLLDKIVEIMPASEHVEKDEREGVRIALIGRPNVGKSTIINRMAKEDRVVAHQMPGTTRDTIDVEVIHNDEHYIFVDTAGIKKKAKTTDKIDKFSTIKSLRAIDDADVVFVVLDAEDGFSKQDIMLAAHSFNNYRPTAILLNKWDAVIEGKKDKKRFQKEYLEQLRFNLKDLRDLPLEIISAKTGYNCNKIFSLASEQLKLTNKRIPTSRLNKYFEDLVEAHPPPDYRGKEVKLKYITQADVVPPVFAIFTNKPEAVKKSYKKYLTKGLRKLFGKTIIPIVVKFRAQK